MSQFVNNLMAAQRKRALGTLMTYLEREVYPHLDPTAQRALRERVIGAIGAYHETTLDVLKAAVSDGSAINQDALTILSRMDANLRTLAREVRHGE